jgi:hypothetical protein
MAASLFLLFNHRITKQQEAAARLSLDVARIINLPSDLKELWCKVPPGLSKIRDYLAPIQDWLKSNAIAKDYVLIQGDFGASYLMVTFAFENGLVPIYSTTYRKAIERNNDDDGSVQITHNFQHQIFRRYGI